MLDWQSFRVIRVPPLKIFWDTSGPMRSQHFELSTNQEPRFRLYSRCWQNLESANLAPMCQLRDNREPLECQWTANWLKIEWDWINNGMSIDCQLKADWLPMVFQLTSNGMSIDYQWNANWIQMECQLTTNGLPIDNHLTTNGVPIECHFKDNGPLQCQLNANWLTLDCHFSINGKPIKYQLIINGMPMKRRWNAIKKSMDYQWSANSVPIEYQLISNGVPIVWLFREYWGYHFIPIESQSQVTWFTIVGQFNSISVFDEIDQVFVPLDES